MLDAGSMRTPPATYGPWRQAAWHLGYVAGHDGALADLAATLDRAREGYERTLAVLREENSTLRRMVEASNSRGDSLTTELARSLVVQPTPPPVLAAPTLIRRPTSPDPIRGLGNVLDPVKIGDPDGEFESIDAASLMAIEESDNADRATA